MHGFFGSYGQSVTYPLSSFGEGYIHRSTVQDRWQAEQITLPKFMDDKPWVDTEHYFYALEGVVFAPHTHLETLYEQYGETFPKVLRGTFSGLFYDKQKQELFVFNDPIGSKMLFYYQDRSGIAFASDWHQLSQAVGQRGSLHRNERFAWSMLSFGYSPYLDSPMKGIVRIGAGEYLHIRPNGCEKRHYFRFDNQPIVRSPQEYITTLDTLFRQAVQRVLDKNNQYHLDTVMSLSAGLDSRMAVCVAKQLTTRPLSVLSYSQSRYYDDTISHTIADAWHCPILYTDLDGGDYLKDIAAATRKSLNLVNYSGPAQVAYACQALDTASCGVFMTGMLGDIVINSRYRKPMPVCHGDGAVSSRFITRVPPITDYPNQELYYLYVRGFNCANLGTPLVMQTFTESYSPFYDVDLLNYCLSIPPAIRYNYRLYDQWILQYYPQAAQWLHNGQRKIGQHPKKMVLCGRDIPLVDVPKRCFWYLSKRLHIHDFYKARIGHSMNPEDSWIKDNQTLKKTLTDYVKENIYLLDFCPQARQAAETLADQGSAMELFNVISLLSAFRD